MCSKIVNLIFADDGVFCNKIFVKGNVKGNAFDLQGMTGVQKYSILFFCLFKKQIGGNSIRKEFSVFGKEYMFVL